MTNGITIHRTSSGATVAVRSAHGAYALSLDGMDAKTKEAVFSFLAGWRERRYFGPSLSLTLLERCRPFLVERA